MCIASVCSITHQILLWQVYGVFPHPWCNTDSLEWRVIRVDEARINARRPKFMNRLEDILFAVEPWATAGRITVRLNWRYVALG